MPPKVTTNEPLYGNRSVIDAQKAASAINPMDPIAVSEQATSPEKAALMRIAVKALADYMDAKAEESNPVAKKYACLDNDGTNGGHGFNKKLEDVAKEYGVSNMFFYSLLKEELEKEERGWNVVMVSNQFKDRTPESGLASLTAIYPEGTEMIGREKTNSQAGGYNGGKGEALLNYIIEQGQDPANVVVYPIDDSAKELQTYNNFFPDAVCGSMLGGTTNKEAENKFEADEDAVMQQWMYYGGAANRELQQKLHDKIAGGDIAYGLCAESSLLKLLKEGKFAMAGDDLQAVFKYYKVENIRALGDKLVAKLSELLPPEEVLVGIKAPTEAQYEKCDALMAEVASRDRNPLYVNVVGSGAVALGESIYDTVEKGALLGAAVSPVDPLYVNASAIKEQKAKQAEQAAATAPIQRAQSAPGDMAVRSTTPPPATARAASAPPTSSAKAAPVALNPEVFKAQQVATPKLDVAKKVNEMLSIYKENVGKNNEGAAAPIKGILNNLKNIFTLGGVNRKQRRDAEYRNKEEKKFLIESVEKLMSNKDFDMNSFIKEGIYINTPSPFALLIETLDEKSQEAIDLRGAIRAAQEKSPKVAWAGVSFGGANNSPETSTDADFIPSLPLKESQEQLKRLLIEKANSSPSNVERLVNGSSESFAIVGGMAIEGAANGVPGVVISTISFGKSGVQFFTTSDKMVVGEDFVIKACEAVPGIGKEAVHPFAVTDPDDWVGGTKGVSGSADSGFMGSADSVLDMIRSPYFDNKAVKDLGGNEKTGNHFYSLKLSGEEEVIIRSNSNQDISVASAKHALGDGGRLRSDVRMAQLKFKYEPLESSQYKDAIMNLLSASPSNQPRSASAMSLDLGRQDLGDERV